jgi:hypothetical protein
MNISTIHACMHACIQVSIHSCTCVCVRARAYRYPRAHAHTRTHTHVHTHTHNHTITQVQTHPPTHTPGADGRRAHRQDPPLRSCTAEQTLHARTPWRVITHIHHTRIYIRAHTRTNARIYIRAHTRTNARTPHTYMDAWHLRAMILGKS